MCHRTSEYQTYTPTEFVFCFVLLAVLLFPSLSLPVDNFSAWNDMISREQTEVRDMRHDLDKFIGEQPAEAKKVQKKIRDLNRELRHVLLVHGISENTPMECRYTLKKMDVLKESVRRGIDPIKNQIKMIDQFEKETQGRKEEYVKLAEDVSLAASVPIIRYYVGELDGLLSSTVKARQLLAFFPNIAEDFLLRLEQRRATVEKRLIDLWKTYFFKPLPSSYFTAEAWHWTSIVAVNWWKFAPLFGLTPGEEQKSAFLDFITQLLGFWLAVSFGGYFFLAWLGKKYPASRPVRHFLPALIWVTLGLSILVNTEISEHFLFGTYQSFGEIFLTGGAVSLAWNLRKTISTAVEPRSGYNILWPLWFIYAVGVFVQVLRIPMVVTTLVFVSLFLLSILYYYLLGKRITNARDRKLAVLTTVLMAVLVLTALLGWGNLTMLVSTFWFMIVLNIELGASLSGYFWRIIHSGRLKSHLLIMLSNMILPLIFIGLLALMVIWASLYMGGMPLLQRIVAWEIDWGVLRLRITTLLTLTALFFLTRSGIAFSHTAIQFQRSKWENIEEGAVKSLQTLSSYILWSCYVIVSLHFLGVGISNLTIIAGGLSVGVGIALQDLLKNFVSGLMLLFGRSIHPGDEIQVDDVRGSVKKINIRSTVVQTNEDSTIFLPNADLVAKKIVNWTHKDPRGRAEIVVGVAYGTDMDLVRELLIRCALTNPDVLKTPPPYVLFSDFGDNALILHLRFWIMHVVLATDRVKSAIRFDIDRVFRENNIEIAYPQQDIHIRSLAGWSGCLEKPPAPPPA